MVLLNKLDKTQTSYNVSAVQLRVETSSSEMEVKKLETNSLTDRQKELLVAFEKYNSDAALIIFTNI